MAYDKLVRDLIPEMIKENGKVPKTRTIENDQEYLKYLNFKLVEEVQEYLAVEEEIDVLEELADIAEVMNAILDVRKLTGLQLEMVRRQKAEKRGTFTKRVFLQDVVGEEEAKKKPESKTPNTPKAKEEKMNEEKPAEAKPSEDTAALSSESTPGSAE